MEVVIIVIGMLLLVVLLFLLIFVDTLFLIIKDKDILLSKDDFRNYAQKAIKENLFGRLICFLGGVVLVIIFKILRR